MHHLWELACLRCWRRGLAGTPQRCHREQARSHKRSCQAAGSAGNAKPVGAGLPAILATRSGRYTAAMPSRASPLPQKILPNRRFCWQCKTCGSWLACDAGDAVWQVHRSDAIASKPAPTKDPAKPQVLLTMQNLWELACLRCWRRGLAGTPQRCHREQARSHKRSCQTAGSADNAKSVGAGLPAMLATRSGRHTAGIPSRASPLPQRRPRCKGRLLRSQCNGALHQPQAAGQRTRQGKNATQPQR